MEIKGKAAVVTGGANGIGFAYVQALLKNGARNVAILDLVNSKGESSAAKLEEQFGRGSAFFIPCDVTKAEQLEAAFKKSIEKFGGIDIIINNAGIADETRWELEININVTAVVRGTLLGLDYMGKQKGGKGGTIVNISSITALRPYESNPIYTATKCAVLGLSRAVSVHHEITGVRVLVLCPGVTETKMITELADKLFEIGKEKSVGMLATLVAQSTDNVAKGLIHIIENGQNGSVWVSEDEKPAYRISFPHYQTLKVDD